MTTMQKFKAYFGMVPPSEYEDDYLLDPADASYGEPSRPLAGARRDEQINARERLYLERYRGAGGSDGYYDDAPYEADYIEADYGQRGGEVAYAERSVHIEAERAPIRGRLEPLGRSGHGLEPLSRGGNVSVRGANALAPEVRSEVVPETSGKISTLRPADYSEARTIGERFRSGSPVIMDLADMSNDDAKRLVDFAAGLAFGLRGQLEKVATKVFLLSPAGTDVSPEERRRIAETGFHNRV